MKMKYFSASMFVLFLLAIVSTLFLCRMRGAGVSGNPKSDSSRQNSRKDLQSFSEEIPYQEGVLEGDASDSIDMSSSELDSMLKNGAAGAVSFRVYDDSEKPVPGAKVHLYFTQPKMDDPSGKVDGLTDENGCFSAEGKSNWACVWTVSKDGFHSSRGKILFTHRGSQKAVRRGRWTIHPIDVPVELKTRSGASLIHGIRRWNVLFYPTNEWVGFDCSACDWVEPLGNGRIPHVSFRSESCGVSPFQKGATPGYTNRLSLRTERGGFSVLRESGDSDSPFVGLLPEPLQTNQLIFTQARTREKILEDGRLKNNEYIVFRSSTGTDDHEAFHCGIIRRLDFSPGELQLEYFFNAEAGDLRVDGDLRSKKDLGK